MPGTDGRSPDYSIRVSDRARRVRLTVTPRDGLVVVVPRRFPVAQVPEIVAGHAVWIARALGRTENRRDRLTAHESAAVPSRVDLPGIGVSWSVVLRAGEGTGVRARTHGEELVLTGDVSDRAACFEALRRAAGRAAKARLPLMLGGVEAETGWSATRVTVRRQRTRWGSCSAAGAISLNASLVFLPPRLVHYILVHELAHTQRLDHSAEFWTHVGRFDARWRDSRRELRDAWRHVPVWADPS